MNELETAIFTTLAGGGALTTLLGGTAIFNAAAGQGQGYPFVTMVMMSEVQANATSHQSAEFRYLVSGWSQRDMSQAGSIDAACKTLLHGQHLSVSGWTNLYTVRESGIREQGEGRDSRPFYRSGGVYRFRLAQ